MSVSVARSYLVTASMATVEALKDHGFARWNYTLRSIHHHVKNSVKKPTIPGGGGSGSKVTAAASVSEVRERAGWVKKPRTIEEKVEKVMEINCWGPSIARF